MISHGQISWSICHGDIVALVENTIDGVRFGAADASQADTTPGSGDLLGPPPGWAGDGEAYFALIRSRYRHQAFKQRFLFMAWHCERSKLVGPFAAEAKEILDSVTKKAPAPGNRNL